MIAGLPMYDRPETAAAHDRYWTLIRDSLAARGHRAPAHLDRTADPWTLWQAPDLVLAQTCGLPYRRRLHGRVALVGTPDYGLPGCPAGHYFSVFVARAGDPRATLAEFAGARLACNDPGSQSGWAAPQAEAQRIGLCYAAPLLTGSHAASARAVADGAADLAALDVISWHMIRRWDPWASKLKPFARSAPTPGLPYIAAPGADTDVLRAAIAAAIARLDTADRAVLELRSLVAIPAAGYLALPDPEPLAPE